MITNKQKVSLVYFITNSFFLASGYSLIFNTSGKDSWISMIVGSFLGVIIICIFNKYIFNKKRNYILNNNINIISKLFMYIFFIFIFFINILVVRIFATSFFLTKTPGLLITIPFILLCYYNAKKGLNSIAKISEILLPISIALIILSMIAVLKDGSVDSFMPILTIGKSKILLSSLYFAIFTAIPQILLFDIKIDKNIHIKSYLASTMITIAIGTIIIFSLGPYLIKIYRFPEYMVLKQIKIFNFIEKIENLIGLIWFFDLFISASLCIYNINKLNKDNDILNIFILIIIAIIIEFVSNHYEYANIIYKNLPVFLLCFGIIIFIGIYIVIKKIKKVAKPL